MISSLFNFMRSVSLTSEIFAAPSSKKNKKVQQNIKYFNIFLLRPNCLKKSTFFIEINPIFYLINSYLNIKLHSLIFMLKIHNFPILSNQLLTNRSLVRAQPGEPFFFFF